MGAVTLGVDIGQRVDPTAIAVVETERRKRADGKGTEVHHLARHVERLPLGTPYPDVASRVAEIATGVCERGSGGSSPQLYLDATGVGTPILDLLKSARVRARLVAVYFTHGDRRNLVDGEVRLGKAWLVSRMQALLQQGLLHLPRTPEAEQLGRELLDYEIKVSEDANDRYGAFKVGSHDDLVTALGLAVQEDRAPVVAAPRVSGYRESWWRL